MTTKRDRALAQLAQQLQVPPQLLNLYPPAANHWTALLPDRKRCRHPHCDPAQCAIDQLAAHVRRIVLEELCGATTAEPQPSCYTVPCQPWPEEGRLD